MASRRAQSSAKATPGSQRHRSADLNFAASTTRNQNKLSLLRSSFKRITEQSQITGLIFYQKLFASEPSLKRLFHTSIELQTRKLMESLGHTVAGLEKPKKLVPVLEAMGRRHVTYGVRNDDYDLLIKALLETFKEVLGKAFTPALHQAWDEALCFVATTMKQGAAKASPRMSCTARPNNP